MTTFANIRNLRAGSCLCADGGFTCIKEGAILEVQAEADESLFVPCDDGKHFLDGQIDDDGGEVVGFYPA
jgi:hypothetical protein